MFVFFMGFFEGLKTVKPLLNMLGTVAGPENADGIFCIPQPGIEDSRRSNSGLWLVVCRRMPTIELLGASGLA